MNGDLMVDLIAGRETLRVSEGLGQCSQIIQDNQVFLPPHCRNLGGKSIESGSSYVGPLFPVHRGRSF